MTAPRTNWQTEEFERHRSHLRAVAYRMLGSLTEADDAVQEAWLRLDRADAAAVENMRGWLTTVVARLCLDKLRARQARRETAGARGFPSLSSRRRAATTPSRKRSSPTRSASRCSSCSRRSTPPERLAFVLHDMFALPFDEIAPIVGRTPVATRQLASRARRRVQGARPEPDVDLVPAAHGRRCLPGRRARRRLPGARRGARPRRRLPSRPRPPPGGGASRGSRGAEEVAKAILERGAPFARFARPALVNGARA